MKRLKHGFAAALSLAVLAGATLTGSASYTDIPAAVLDDATHTVVIAGDLGEIYANQTVTGMLLDSNADIKALKKDDISHLFEIQTDAAGSYNYQFGFDGDVDNCKLYINQAGLNLSSSVTEATAKMDLYQVSSVISTYNGAYEISVQAKDLFLSGDGSFQCVVAFYDVDDNLVAIDCGDRTLLTDYVNVDTLTGNIPNNAKTMKLFVWDSVGTMIPIADGQTERVDRTYDPYIRYRGKLVNTYKKLSAGEDVLIGYIGGSVTNASQLGELQNVESWRKEVTNLIGEKFPDATVTDINAAIGGTGSRLGMYRIDHDLLYLQEKVPDLVFIEFAINDWYNGDSDDTVAIQYETLIQKIYKANPDADIVALYVTDDDVSVNEPPYFRTARIQDSVAAYYDITSVNMGRALGDYIANNDEGKGWDDFFLDNVHPNVAGHDFYRDVIAEMLEDCLFNLDQSTVDGYQRTIKEPVFRDCMPDAKGIYAADIEGTFDGWTKGSWFLECTTAGKEITIPFEGTVLGLYKEKNSSAQGGVEYQIDGTGEWKTLLFNGGGNPPDMLATGLEDGPHTVTFRSVAGEEGCNVRIRSILVER